MGKFLYLTEIEWSSPWINGGNIPLYLASKYLYPERNGVLTPDENLIHESPVNLKNLSPLIHIPDGANVKGLSIVNCSVNGQRIPDIVNANYYTEDGIILSLCNSFSEDIARRLSKKACVKIINLEKLRRSIDKQVGFKGIMKECEYTTCHQRNHFLKSAEDKWQDEYRIFWRYPKNIIVKIPNGIAEFVATFA